ncbi:DUF599 domain-containing protein [Roseovarius salis]|uniref:DUF599 domain-containing protein n=1 Tax=Roseovarius salis TaxID=3376063 RepID=UPI0037C79A25
MNWSDRLSLFTPLDFWAVAVLFASWVITGLLIEHPLIGRASVSRLMARYRREWMTQMIDRQPRVFDGQIMLTLRQGTTFFASTTMIAIGGALALLGNMERFIGVASDLTLEKDPAIVWEVKVLILLVFLANAFLKFVWAHRLFGYGSVLMAAVPNDPEDPQCAARASQAGEIINTAARSFNRGLRSVYFALASAVFMIGPVALMAAVAITWVVLLRREFASHSRAVLLKEFDTKS